ncbi:hypothetical protein [Devosia beringensis]|uniref:hypothetical protein n=1 Tax=Devosia beringensis TaxID=2657486 RepID=UPI00186B86FA|nr:hypothetical protein [Devosia beringensis]
MRRLLWTVATVCLLQAAVLSFVLVPIKVQGFPSIGQSPAVWLILDLDFVLKTSVCFEAREPARCIAGIGEIFAFAPRLGIRIVLCFLAAASGVVSFRWLYKPPNPQ